MAAPNAQQSEIRYLNPVTVDVRKKKYCRFKKAGIKYVDYKDAVQPPRNAVDQPTDQGIEQPQPEQRQQSPKHGVEQVDSAVEVEGHVVIPPGHRAKNHFLKPAA